MKSWILAAGLATLMSGAAFAQTSTGTDAGTTPPAAGSSGAMGNSNAMSNSNAMGASNAMAANANNGIITLPAATEGAAPTHYLADDVQGEDIYNANDEEIGEIEDLLMNPDGSVAAVVVEVGGFLGVGEKDVLVDWKALQIGMDGDDLRITTSVLTREALENAPDVDLESMTINHSDD